MSGSHSFHNASSVIHRVDSRDDVAAWLLTEGWLLAEGWLLVGWLLMEGLLVEGLLVEGW